MRDLLSIKKQAGSGKLKIHTDNVLFSALAFHHGSERGK
jgi:hypothetical protein